MAKNVNVSVNSKALAVAALGAGILVGASTAYIITRINEHSNLTHMVAHLHNTIIEVKEEIAHLENELRLSQRAVPLSEEKVLKKRHRKAVSFCSTATSSSYKTAAADLPSDGQTDSDSWKSTYNYDTDYFSPDDEDDEFYDISPSDNEVEDHLVPLSVSTTEDDISDNVSGLSSLLRTVDNLLDKSPEEQTRAYQLLIDKGDKFKDNAEILWRKAKATRNRATIEELNGNLAAKKDLIFEAYEYAEQALRINDQSAEVHKWFAILAGTKGEFLSMKERIANGHTFKRHIDIALKISPNDSMLYHLLGRFCYEVAVLSWVEKKVASALFGEVPSSTYEEALRYFMAAEEARPESWKENRMFIAKCHLKLSHQESGTKWLKEALRLPTSNVDDELMNNEAREMLSKSSISSP